MKSRFKPIPAILAISREVMLKFSNFSLEIMKNMENCHWRISQYTQTVKHSITFPLNSRKFSSWPVDNTSCFKRSSNTVFIWNACIFCVELVRREYFFVLTDYNNFRFIQEIISLGDCWCCITVEFLELAMFMHNARSLWSPHPPLPFGFFCFLTRFGTTLATTRSVGNR